MSQLRVQNFYSTTATSDIITLWDTSFTVAVAPTYTSGFLVISPNNSALREIVYFHAVVGTTISIRAENRWLGGTTAKLHTSTETVAINDVAEIFNMFSDSLSQCFFIEKTGGLTVKAWGGTVFYNWNPVTVADTNLTLADNQTNYIKYSYPTNTISVDTVNSGNIKARAIVASGVITSLTYYVAKESYIDFTVTITWALPSQTGNANKALITDGTNVSWGTPNLPRNIGINKHIVVDRPTGIEVIKDVTDGTVVATTDKIRLQESSWDYADIPYSIIFDDISWANDRVLVAWEGLTLNDAIYKEEVLPYSATTTLAPRAAVQKMWDSSANTRIELWKIIWNWWSTNTIKAMVRKVLAPTDNCILRIETDDWTGKPSWTLAHANATALIAWTWLTTWFVETTYTAAWNYVLTDLTVYHLIAQRSWAVDAWNHYEFAHLTKNVRAFITNTYNGTVWWTPITTKQAYFAISNCYQWVFVKTNATNKDQIWFEWFAKAAAAIWQTVKVASTGIIKSFSWLTTNKAYYLSNTAGLISTTEGTNKVAVWFSDSSSSISIIPFPDGYQDATNWYTIDNIATINGTTYTRFLRITDYRYIRYTWTAWIYAYFYVNWVSQTSWTSVLCKPWDEVVLVYNSSGGGYPWTITVETSALKNIWIPITI